MATIPEALAIALQHHQGGRLQAAEQIYRQILAVEPNHADALHLLGVIAAQVGKHDVAIETIRRAISLKGSAAVFHNNLGEAYRALHRLPEAVACCRRAVELKPDYAEAHYNLGSALKEQGDRQQAIACYRRAVELKPDYIEADYNLGNTLREQGNLDEAVTCYRRVIQRKPDHAKALNNLGITLKDQGKIDDAVACCRRALELMPDSAEVHCNLGSILKEQGSMDEAVAFLRRALELKPDFAEAHYNLGSSLAEMGELQAAEDSLRAALRCNSRFAFAHCKLAEILGGRLPEIDLAAQLRLLDDRELTDSQRLLLHFGLAHVLDARGKYTEAAEHLEQGNALRLSELRIRGQAYDPKEYELLVTRMIAVCTPDFFQRVSGFGLESEIPVFVVGLPRSGTTLIEQILASHSQVFGAGEIQLARDSMAALTGQDADSIEGLRHLNRPTARRLAARHLEKLREFHPTALRIVDKMPENYFFLGLLASLFPRAKFIHCRRGLHDVAVSCWMTHFQEVRWANDQQHMVLRFYDYRRLMKHWRNVLPVPMLEIDYEETVADLEAVARRLVAWCGLEWEPGCLEFHRTRRVVRTASAVQVRQPVYQKSVGRWKHYERALGPLFTRLERLEDVGAYANPDSSSSPLLTSSLLCLPEGITQHAQRPGGE